MPPLRGYSYSTDHKTHKTAAYSNSTLLIAAGGGGSKVGLK